MDSSEKVSTNHATSTSSGELTLQDLDDKTVDLQRVLTGLLKHPAISGFTAKKNFSIAPQKNLHNTEKQLLRHQRHNTSFLSGLKIRWYLVLVRYLQWDFLKLRLIVSIILSSFLFGKDATRQWAVISNVGTFSSAALSSGSLEALNELGILKTDQLCAPVKLFYTIHLPNGRSIERFVTISTSYGVIGSAVLMLVLIGFTGMAGFLLVQNFTPDFVLACATAFGIALIVMKLLT
ncbi:hypothetical protein T439DRAFT_378594 [Meredithblackwellia eburnea MCA 4105]